MQKWIYMLILNGKNRYYKILWQEYKRQVLSFINMQTGQIKVFAIYSRYTIYSYNSGTVKYY